MTTTIGERIKAVRLCAGESGKKITQEEFAAKIGATQTAVYNYETNRNNPSNAMISIICQKFNVNEFWLRTGEGEMFGERSREDEIMSFVADVLNDDKSLKAKFLQALIEMRDEDLELILKLAKKLAED